MMRRRLALHGLSALVLLPGCAAWPGQEPLRVHVVNLDALESAGMELRFMCLLRVQNPNETDFPYSGASLDLQVRGSAFASGVADISGTVPRFGEVLVSVPVSASAMSIARLAIGLFLAEERPKLDYLLRGRLGSSRFESRGELTLPDLRGGGPPMAS